jgi:hypothetical protein
MSDATWTPAQFDELTTAEELVLVIARAGHDTLRFPVWMVTVGAAAYVRSYLGVSSMWFRRVQAEADQAISFDGADLEVRFENVDRLDPVNRAIDAEFDRKYASFDYVDSTSEPAAVEATLRLVRR